MDKITNKSDGAPSTLLSKEGRGGSSIKVSVIMPVYNSGKYLKTAVESILNQSLNELELILVDDGSTDGSSEQCDEYAAKDSRVVVIHEKNGGICHARNAALKIARGEYIGFSDHDDRTELNAFESAYSFAKKHYLDMLKYGHDVISDKDGEIVKVVNFNFKEQIYKGKEVGKHYLQLLKDGAMQCVWDSLFRREFLSKNNLQLDTSYKAGGEDIDFCGRVISYKPALGIMNGIYYHHLYHIGLSTSSKFHDINVKLALGFPKKLDSYLNSYGYQKIYNNNPELYAYTITYRSIASLLHTVAIKGCDYSSDIICALLEQLKKDNNINSTFNKASQIKLLSKSRMYGIIYIFFRHGWLRPLANQYIKKRNNNG